MSPIRLDVMTLGDRAAVLRGKAGRDGDRVLWWHPLSRNPITSGTMVVAISNCHLLLCVTWMSYFVRNMIVCTWVLTLIFIYIVISNICMILLNGCPLWAPLNNKAWKKQWVTVNHGKKKSDETAVAVVLLFPLQSTPHWTPANRNPRGHLTSFKVCASFCNYSTSTVKIFPVRYFLQSLATLAWGLS